MIVRRRGSMWALVRKEVRLLTRSRMAFWGLALVLILAGGIVCMFWADEGNSVTLNDRADFGLTVFVSVSTVLLGSLMLLAPVLGATSFTDERERKTYDLLASAGFSHPAMILGKWMAALFYQLLLVVCLAPIMTVILQLGGVEPDQFAKIGFLLVVTAATYTMMGLAISANFRSSMRAMVAAVGMVIMLTLGVYAVLGLAAFLFGIYGGTAWFYVFSVFSPLPGFFMTILGGQGAPFSTADAFSIFGVSYAGFLAISFLLARFGLKRADKRRGLGPAGLIDDPKLLRQRRISFPFYLIDPLRRAQNIADRSDPLVAREERAGSSARLRTMIRLVYAAAAVSVLTGAGYAVGSVENNMNYAVKFALFISLLFFPLDAATAITREREQGTFDLLRTLPVTSWRVVCAKWRASLRLILVLFGGAMVLPVLLGLIFHRNLAGHLVELVRVIPYGVSYLALYSAVAIVCSAKLRRNAAALVLTYVICAGLLLAPLAAASIHQEWMMGGYNHGSDFKDLPVFVRAAMATISPLMPVGSASNSRYNLFGMSETWGAVMVQLALTALLTWLCLRLAARRLEHAKD